MSGLSGGPARLDDVLIGDRLGVDGREPELVESIFLCSERLLGTLYTWRWLFLADGSLVEAAPKGLAVYRRHRVVLPGSGLFAELLAQDGALVRFEERVRDGSVEARPVRVSLDGRSFRVASTGNVAVRRLGVEPTLAPWRAFDDDQAENVYVSLVSVEDANQLVLGLWTDALSLSFGAATDPARIVPVVAG